MSTIQEEMDKHEEIYKNSIEGIIRCLALVKPEESDNLLNHTTATYKSLIAKLKQPNLKFRDEHLRLKRAYEEFFDRYEAYAKIHNKRFRRLV